MWQMFAVGHKKTKQNKQKRAPVLFFIFVAIVYLNKLSFVWFVV